MSEEIKHCNNCKNLGLDFEAGKFYCSLSYRPDELPEVLGCDEFSINCYIKRLQEENEELKETTEKGNKTNADLIESIVRHKEKISKYKQVFEEIREIINEQNLISDKPISQSECTLERLCNYEEKYIKIVDKINEVLNDRD